MPGREQHHRRVGGRGARRDRFQGREQLVRVVLHRRDAVAGEQLRKQPHHDLAVLQHVGDAGGRAGIVLEDVEGVGIDPHDVDAGDMDVDVVRHLEAVHLRPEHRVLEDEVLGHDAGLERLAAAVDVLDVEVERLDALLEPEAQPRPFVRRQDARQHVERDQPLGRVGIAIDGEGDADAPEQELRLAPPVLQHVGWQLAQPALEAGIDRPNLAVRLRHFVECDCHSLPPQPKTPRAPRDRI